MSKLWHSVAVQKTGLVMLLAWAGISLLPARQASAQASLVAGDVLDQVDVQVGGRPLQFTLIRDAKSREMWYYVPSQPRLLEYQRQGEIEPEFALLRYQFESPDTPGKLIEDGLLQFAATLAAPPEALPKLREFLASKGYPGVRLAPLPFESAEVSLYAPGAPNALFAAAPMGAGVAPMFATQSMVFSVPLTRVGSDVLEALVKGNTGVPVAVTFTFNALTPPAGFTLTVDWDQTYKHYSEDQRFRAEASYYGWFGASYESSRTDIYNTLVQNKDIQLEVITGENFTLADAEKFLQPILQLINAELLEAQKPPAQIDPAAARAPSAGGYFGSAGYSVAVKNVQNSKRGTTKYSMKVQHTVKRKTIASGFVGVGRYTDAVKNRLITVVPASEQQATYFVLPAVAGLAESGVASLSLEAGLSRPGAATAQSQIASWTAGRGWTCLGSGTSRPCQSLSFNLLGAKGLTDTKIAVQLSLPWDSGVITAAEKFDLSIGQRLPIASVNKSLVQLIEVDGGNLTFRRFDAASSLIKAEVRVTLAENLLFAGTLQPEFFGGQLSLPRPLRWIVKPADLASRPVTAKLRFLLNDGTWRERTEQVPPPYSLSLLDAYWK